MNDLLEMMRTNPIAEAASAMASSGSTHTLDEALEEGFFPPEAEDHFALKDLERFSS